MTIETFMKRFGIKRRSTVEDWIRKDYIPGVSIGENGDYVIPEDALPPYTKARAKGKYSVLLSILKGICSKRQVIPELYGMSKKTFDDYITILESEGMISIETIDDINYYRPTIQGEQYVFDNVGARRFFKKIQPLVEAVVSGTGKTLIDYNDTH